jgi:hypothetical protein
MNGLLRPLVSTLCALMLAAPAQAQLDPGAFDIFQDGKKVGEIFVPARPAGQTHYIEHWVLFREYVYPAGTSGLKTVIEAAQRGHATEADFLAHVAWGPGFRYVRIEVADTDKLPGRP